MGEKFWIVINEARAASAYPKRHRSYISASREAERIAKDSPGAIVHVLESLGYMQVNQSYWTKSHRPHGEHVCIQCGHVQSGDTTLSVITCKKCGDDNIPF